MKRIMLALAALLVLSPVAYAGDDVEKELYEARKKVDDAARTLAELYRQKYDRSDRKKKAMLGILLGDKPNKNGVELVGVTPGGGAEAVGIQAGDLITKLDDLELGETEYPMKSLSKYMKGVKPGDEVALAYVRDGKSHAVTLTTQAHSAHMLRMISKQVDSLDLDLDLDIDFDDIFDVPEVQQALAIQGALPSRQFLSVDGDLAEYFDVKSGVVLIEPPKGSNLKAGDVIQRVAGTTVTDLASVKKLLGDMAQKSDVSVLRKGKYRNVSVAEPEFAHLHGGLSHRVIRVETPDDSGSNAVIIKIQKAEKPKAPPTP